MRLWHYKLIPHLPRQQLLGQHRECCALRGKGWNRKHSTVDYVFKYLFSKLVSYHLEILHEMQNREYQPNSKWFFITYRGKELGFEENKFTQQIDFTRYPEHDDDYLLECLNNLEKKGINLKSKFVLSVI